MGENSRMQNHINEIKEKLSIFGVIRENGSVRQCFVPVWLWEMQAVLQMHPM